MIANRLASSIFVIVLLTSGAIRSPTVAAKAAGKPVKQTGGGCTGERPLVSGHCACLGQKTGAATACGSQPGTPPGRVATVLLGQERHSDNCVFFVRDRVRSLPYGLGTWKGKLAIINARVQRAGDVAVIEVGSGVYRDVGHVAIIEQVTANSLTIFEANFYAGRVSRRTATGANAGEAAALLGIAGYFRP